MANIGTFTAEKDGFTGTLRTLTLNVKVKLVPNDKGDTENAPDFHLQATGYAGVASLMRRRPGACACWKIPAWMRATHILLGSPITMPWCSYTPTPTHHPMRIPSSSGAFLGASN
ncbi:DUF736 domain-containing protein [Pluralibacter gergoviae]